MAGWLFFSSLVTTGSFEEESSHGVLSDGTVMSKGDFMIQLHTSIMIAKSR